ncbi:unnamed protein product, partial [Phaeothamnion confervicola]
MGSGAGEERKQFYKLFKLALYTTSEATFGRHWATLMISGLGRAARTASAGAVPAEPRGRQGAVGILS